MSVENKNYFWSAISIVAKWCVYLRTHLRVTLATFAGQVTVTLAVYLLMVMMTTMMVMVRMNVVRTAWRQRGVCVQTHWRVTLATFTHQVTVTLAVFTLSVADTYQLTAVSTVTSLIADSAHAVSLWARCLKLCFCCWLFCCWLLVKLFFSEYLNFGFCSYMLLVSLCFYFFSPVSDLTC